MYNRILITGATGFVGQVLLPALATAYPTAKLFAVGSGRQPGQLGCNLADRQAVQALINHTAPDCVLNLAAISHIPTAWDNPDQTWRTNLDGVRHLLDALTARNTPCTFLQAGSGDCYGSAFRTGDAVTESTAFEPQNPYAASKAAADLACCASTNSQLTIIRARPFNHTGAGQSNQFVIPAFAEQIARIEAGQQEPTINVGNLDAHRCFLHVNDVVDAYLKLLSAPLQSGTASAYNIVADHTHSIADVLQSLLSQTPLEISIHHDPARSRPSDIPMARGDASQLKQLTGWTPRHDLTRIVSDVLQYWRTQTTKD